VAVRPVSRASRPPGRPAGRAAGRLLADQEALLAAAERCIAALGPSASLEEIAAEAGVTKPILYRGVGDKDALVEALAARLAARMAAAVTQLVAGSGGGRDAVEQLVRGYLEHAAVDRHLYLYVTAGSASQDRLRGSLALAERTATRFAERIAGSRAAHGEDPAVATVWSFALIGALHYVTLWWLRDAALPLEQAADHLTTLLWQGLQPRAHPPSDAPRET
jgi:AcrR family transcriptional regulator